MSDALALPVALAAALMGLAVTSSPRHAGRVMHWWVLALSLAAVGLFLAEGLWVAAVVWALASAKWARRVGETYELQLHRRRE